jgi:hypothetical protein
VRDTACRAAQTADFKKFQINYLTVYYLAMMGDWLQARRATPAASIYI